MQNPWETNSKEKRFESIWINLEFSINLFKSEIECDGYYINKGKRRILEKKSRPFSLPLKLSVTGLPQLAGWGRCTTALVGATYIGPHKKVTVGLYNIVPEYFSK